MSRIGKAFAIVGAVLIAAFLIMVVVVNSIRPRNFGDGTSAVGSLRTINTAEITYASTYPKTGFSPSLVALGGSTAATFQPNEEAAGLIDPNLSSGLKAGYRFTYSVTRDEKSGLNVAYGAHADPVPGVPPEYRSPGGDRYFYSDQTGVIRWEKDHEANASSPPLQ